MKPDDCPDYETLAISNRLPAGDARRAHLDGCAICRAKVAALAEFERDAGASAADDDAMAELSRRRVRDGLVPGEPPRVVPLRRAAWPGRVLAFAALFVAVFGAWFAMRANHPPQMRATDEAPWRPSVERAGREVVLRWSARAQADDYRLRFYDESLTRLGEIDAGVRLEWRLDRDSLPGGVRARAVEVTVMHGGDSLAVSRIVSLPVR